MKDKKINVRIGSKEEKAWTEIKSKCESEIEQFKRMIDINHAIIYLARKKITEEQKA